MSLVQQRPAQAPKKASKEAKAGLTRLADPDSQPDKDQLTIEQLAQQTGMTVRNIRAHQSRGLLPPPSIQGRTGFYGADHVSRLRLISEMQADGFNLAAIKQLVDAAGGAAGDVLDFKHMLTAPYEQEQPEFVTAQELEQRWGTPLDGKLLRRAEKDGLIRSLGEGRYEVPSPTLYRAGEQLLALGIPLATVVGMGEKIRRHSDAIAGEFAELFVENIWKPFVAAGRPAEEWPRVREALARLRPLAADAVLAAFRQSMTRASEEAFGKQVASIADKD